MGEITTERREILCDSVLRQLQAGVKQTSIIHNLEMKGLTYDQANEIYNEVNYDYERQSNLEDCSEKHTPKLTKPVVASVLISIAGGIAWSALAIISDYEFGFVAWFIGLVSGLGAAKFAGGAIGRATQVIAAASSVIGIALGKYLIFTHYYLDSFYGEFFIYFAEITEAFIDYYSTYAEPYDALWLLLAIGTAWRIVENYGTQERVM